MDWYLALSFSFRLLAVSQVLLFASYLIVFDRQKIGLLVAAASLCFGVYLFMPIAFHSGAPGIVLDVMDVFASSIPALVWLIARLFFVDNKPIPIWFWLLWLLYMVLWIPNWRDGQMLGEAGTILFELVPQLLKLGFVVHAIVLALTDRDSDLVNQRQALRVPIAVGAGSLTSLVILIELWAGDDMPVLVELLGSLLMFVVTFCSSLFLFQMRSEFAELGQSMVPRSDRDTTHTNFQVEIDRIDKQMTIERFYANHGATISDLAKEIALPEHKLRTIINQGLGFRNFNQFLNHYRINEASERLLTEPALPVLTIALDVGFKSLSSFNKFFKEIHDCTPTDYRSRTTLD